MQEAFFVPEGDGFRATRWTRGPWDERFQHAGPPSALVARAMEPPEPDGMRVARFTIDIPKPIPIALMHIETRAIRTSKRAQLSEAVLRAGDDEVAYARAWRIREEPDAVDATKPEPPTAPGPDGFAAGFGYEMPDPSYFTAVEWRFARGSFVEPGPGAAWIRMRVSLVAGEEIRPLSRVLVAADSGNGISRELDLLDNLFVNTDLSVHLFRMPVGEWVLIDARTRIDGEGVGLTTSAISDEQVRIGSGAQALLCARR